MYIIIVVIISYEFQVNRSRCYACENYYLGVLEYSSVQSELQWPNMSIAVLENGGNPAATRKLGS